MDLADVGPGGDEHSGSSTTSRSPVAFFQVSGGRSLLDDRPTVLLSGYLSLAVATGREQVLSMGRLRVCERRSLVQMVRPRRKSIAGEYRRMGFYSLFLTLANIVLIWISHAHIPHEGGSHQEEDILGGYHHSAQNLSKRAVMTDLVFNEDTEMEGW
jgi:hypothetical protein